LNPDEKLCGDWEVARTLIYEVNDRHEYFERYVRFYRSQNKVAEPPKLSLTRIYKSKKLVLNDEMFMPGRSILQKEGFAVLDEFCGNLTSQSVDNAEIVTYTDETGDAIANDEISMQRGALIKEYTRRKFNIQEKRIKINGQMQGNSAPSPSSTVKAKKRRIEVMIYLHE
ncbi:MAG: OmpA family protein, partial [Bacteroidota bacterium]